MESQVQQIEYEQVTIQIPKNIMDFLRRFKKDAEAYLQYEAVDGFRANLERAEAEDVFLAEILDEYDFEPIFKAVLDDC